VEHVSTQLPYALTVAAVSFVSYVIAGLLQSVGLYWWVSLPIGLALMVATIFGIKFFQDKKSSKQEI
jgi:Na+/H+ antiporter NhaC